MDTSFGWYVVSTEHICTHWSKTPQSVINVIKLNWVGAGYGVMKSILMDNGGEFSAYEIREVSSVLNIEVCTTATYGLFQNGLCEWIHAVTESMLTKLVDQCPRTSLNILLTLANMARNSLQIRYGYTSYQLEFWSNPNLPNIMTDNLPALQGARTSEILAKHLQALWMRALFNQKQMKVSKTIQNKYIYI